MIVMGVTVPMVMRVSMFVMVFMLIVMMVFMTVVVRVNVELHAFNARFVFARRVHVELTQVQFVQFAFERFEGHA